MFEVSTRIVMIALSGAKCAIKRKSASVGRPAVQGSAHWFKYPSLRRCFTDTKEEGDFNASDL